MRKTIKKTIKRKSFRKKKITNKKNIFYGGNREKLLTKLTINRMIIDEKNKEINNIMIYISNLNNLLLKSYNELELLSINKENITKEQEFSNFINNTEREIKDQELIITQLKNEILEKETEIENINKELENN